MYDIMSQNIWKQDSQSNKQFRNLIKEVRFIKQKLLDTDIASRKHHKRFGLHRRK